MSIDQINVYNLGNMDLASKGITLEMISKLEHCVKARERGDKTALAGYNITSSAGSETSRASIEGAIAGMVFGFMHSPMYKSSLRLVPLFVRSFDNNEEWFGPFDIDCSEYKQALVDAGLWEQTRYMSMMVDPTGQRGTVTAVIDKVVDGVLDEWVRSREQLH